MMTGSGTGTTTGLIMTGMMITFPRVAQVSFLGFVPLFFEILTLLDMYNNTFSKGVFI
jgi:hypothetical protein